jgi:heme/copper-type cytochrome/quinol oxidase subunit 3
VSTAEQPVGITRPTNLPTYPRGAEQGRSPAFWGMVLLIFTEATFFAILFLSYVYLRFQSGSIWPPPPLEKPNLFLVSIMTPVLVLSSVPAHLAEAGIRRGNLRRLRLGLVLTIAQAGAFIGLTVMEWMEKIHTEHLKPWTNAYGSIFFTIVGFHGVHVAVGVLLLLWLLIYAFRGRWTEESHIPVQNVILYWHFVDVVWLFIITLLYFSPHWWP